MRGDLPETLLRQISPAQIRWYAVQSGWKPVDGITRPLIVLNHPTDGLSQIAIPTRGNDKDVAFLMGEAIRKIATFEDRAAAEVLADVVLPPSDVLRLRVQSRETTLGTLPLDEGLRLFQGGRDLLLAAACSVHHPQAYYPRQSFIPAQEFLSTCRLGQTERGSFVVTILAPVPPQLSNGHCDESQEEIDRQQEPYERRTTLLLMEALNLLRHSIDLGTTEHLLRAWERGVSANLCEALASISPPDTMADLQVSMTWSRTRPQAPRNHPAQVSFAQGEFGIIREAGRKLRAVTQPRKERFEGLITGLQAEPAQLLEEGQGSVTIRTLIDGRSARLRFILKQSQYAQACDAHRDRHRVAITGILLRDAQSRLIDLILPEGFQILTTETFKQESL